LAEYILEMKNITKTFPGVVALDNVNLQVKEGEIHAVVGENGAGKSTLMNVLSGIHPFGSYTGEILYKGKLCRFGKIKDSEDEGIVIVHQELALVPYMTIGENMYLGNEQGHKAAINWDVTYAKADQYLTQVGLAESSRTLIKDIGVGKQQLVEIAKALAKHAKLLILDEPTSSLNEEDSQALLDMLLEFKNHGLTSIIISHKLNEIVYVSDSITILRDGASIETLDKYTDDVSEDRIIKSMVGRELTDRYPERVRGNIGEIALEVKDWNVTHPLYSERQVVKDVSFNVRKGEVVAISGLMGAGRTELAMSIFGRSYGRDIQGGLYIKGEAVRLNNVKDAIRHKLAYVTEDRKLNGLILGNTIKINTSLAYLEGVSKAGIIDGDREYMVAEEYRDKLKTKTPSVEQKVGNLSGGNQQKVLLSKWIFAAPEILILDEPTRGIDVGAKYEIYTIINSLVAEGKSVIMISSELSEVLGMADRVYVMDEGKMVGELEVTEASQEKIMSLIIKSDEGREVNRQ
jgi:putative multiple sugar transport system ATP-binding protein